MIPIATQQAGAVAGATARANLAPDIVQGGSQQGGRDCESAASEAAAGRRQDAADGELLRARDFCGEQRRDLEARRVAHGRASAECLRSAMGQQYNQAIDEFALAVLRKESGAAISPSEHAQFAQTYFAQPGDDPRRSRSSRRRACACWTG
jgi:hypothetical protein